MHRPTASDQAITQKVSQKLANRGVRSPCHVGVQTNKGQVTLSGTVQYAHQKVLATAAAVAVTGVRRVVNQLTLKPSAGRLEPRRPYQSGVTVKMPEEPTTNLADPAGDNASVATTAAEVPALLSSEPAISRRDPAVPGCE